MRCGLMSALDAPEAWGDGDAVGVRWCCEGSCTPAIEAGEC
jgi:hypothetical protein